MPPVSRRWMSPPPTRTRSCAPPEPDRRSGAVLDAAEPPDHGVLRATKSRPSRRRERLDRVPPAVSSVADQATGSLLAVRRGRRQAHVAGLEDQGRAARQTARRRRQHELHLPLRQVVAGTKHQSPDWPCIGIAPPAEGPDGASVTARLE